MKLQRDFFTRDALTVARSLPGKNIVKKIKNKKMVVKIVETEAYLGAEDKASHAYKNNKTRRTRPMFKIGGFSYIYLIYGMYYCFNVVTGPEKDPQAVLIRAAEPIQGLDIIKQNRKINPEQTPNLTNGPGKLCEALNLDKKYNNIDLVKNKKLYLTEGTTNNIKINKGPRKNIDYAEEYKYKKWRFYIKDNKYIS